MKTVVCLCCDVAMSPLAWVLARRLEAVLRRSDDIHIYVLGEPPPALARGIRAKIVGVRFDELDVPQGDDGHLPRSAYLRLLLPRLVDPAYGRALYLDCDVYPEGALRPLLELNLQGRTAAAVTNQVGFKYRHEIERANLLRAGLDPDAAMLNSGVLLLDLEKCRRSDLSGQALALLRQSERAFSGMDQDVLNVLLQGDWQELSPVWNLQTTLFGFGLEDALRPAIRHFKGPIKPWHKRLWRHGSRDVELYEAAFAGSPWPRFIEDRKSPAQWRARTAEQLRDVRWAFRRSLAFLPGPRRRVIAQARRLRDFRKLTIERIIASAEAKRYADVAQDLTQLDLAKLRLLSEKQDETLQDFG